MVEHATVKPPHNRKHAAQRLSYVSIAFDERVWSPAFTRFEPPLPEMALPDLSRKPGQVGQNAPAAGNPDPKQ